MTVSPDIRTALVEAVRTAARDEILPRFRRLDPATIEAKTGPFDLVTVADTAAELAIAQQVAQILPDALFVGEEAVAEDPGLLDQLSTAPLAVIVDPIDGTSNFANDIATFGTILAVVDQGETVFGVLYDPVLDDWVWAARGDGAWFERPGEPPRRLSGPPERSQDTTMGFAPLNQFSEAKQMELIQHFKRLGRLHNLRCSCHEYRMLALGHMDYIVTATGKPWDHAAGCLVVEECGGAVAADGVPGYRPGEFARHLAVLGRPGGRITIEDLQIK